MKPKKGKAKVKEVAKEAKEADKEEKKEWEAQPHPSNNAEETN